MSDQNGRDQFPGEPRPDHVSTETKQIHGVIFNALMGGKNILDEASANPGTWFAAMDAPTPPPSATPRSGSAGY